MENRISDIQLVPIKSTNGHVAFASLVFDNKIYLGNIGIFTRPQGGFRLTYPTRKISNNSFPIFHPINNVTTNEIEEAVVAKFEKLLRGSSTISFKI